MKLKNVDGELYLDRESKIFFKDDVIPDEYKDKTKYDVYVHPFNRPKKEDEDEVK
jgi:hypothetical protein